MTFPPNRVFQVFYDGACPICMREIRMLRRKDKLGRIEFTDISVGEFEPSAYGKTHDDFMSSIKGRLPDGSFVEGVEVFRRLYDAVGLGWLVAPTKLPGLRQLSDAAYRAFARNRLRLTGRCNTASCSTG